MTPQQAIQDARSAAEFQSTALWSISGFLVPIIAVLIAVARKPSVDASALAKHNDKETETIFCAEYVAVLRWRQINAAFTGAAVWLIVLVVVAFIVLG